MNEQENYKKFIMESLKKDHEEHKKMNQIISDAIQDAAKDGPLSFKLLASCDRLNNKLTEIIELSPEQIRDKELISKKILFFEQLNALTDQFMKGESNE